ncbi:hypothetical protein B0H11DRAFT_2072077 [Mycena galericulata]|nr:hypothetical protein B0H11DRAFT_2072077 [Mycena galericulata]
MRCGLRLLPLLDPLSFVPIIYWYLANRTGFDALGYAFLDCDRDALANAVLFELTAQPVISDTTLRGITALCLLYPAPPFDCESIYSIIQASIGSHSSVAYLSVKAILSSMMLSSLAWKLLERRTEDARIGPNADTSSIELIQEVYAHPLWAGSEQVSSSISIDTILSKIADEWAAGFIHFLSACTSDPEKHPYRAAATIKRMSVYCNPELMQSMSADAQREFAETVSNFTKLATNTENPHRASFGLIARGFWADLADKLPKYLSDTRSLVLIAEAYSLYETDVRRLDRPPDLRRLNPDGGLDDVAP